jgi:hypothetical protein
MIRVRVFGGSFMSGLPDVGNSKNSELLTVDGVTGSSP